MEFPCLLPSPAPLFLLLPLLLLLLLGLDSTCMSSALLFGSFALAAEEDEVGAVGGPYLILPAPLSRITCLKLGFAAYFDILCFELSQVSVLILSLYAYGISPNNCHL
jgi:hypothetical protein